MKNFDPFNIRYFFYFMILIILILLPIQIYYGIKIANAGIEFIKNSHVRIG